MKDKTTTVAGEEVRLLPERALDWPARRTLFVTDPHIGKIASLRAHGAPLPGGSTAADLRRLSRLIERTGPERLVILGDLYHARAGRLARPTAEAFSRWRQAYQDLELVLVPGNHDAAAGLPVLDLDIDVVAPGHLLEPFVLRHDPVPAEAGYVLAGHLHPGASLRGPGGERVRLPCFWIRPRYAVLPAFGGTTGLKGIEPDGEDRVFAIAEEEVIEL